MHRIHHARPRRRRAVAAAAAALLAGAAPAAAQTDYYNTDAGRPLRVEDASPIERNAFELQAAPLHLERGSGGEYRWGIEPELAWGALPRTQVEIGLPLAALDAAGHRVTGAAGLDLGVLHGLNAETLSLPAFAVGARALLPVGGLAPESPYGAVRAIATRTFPAVRAHLNAEVTLGPTDGAGHVAEMPRWLAGLALDRTFPLAATLVGAEVVAEQPLDDRADVRWSVGAGVRRQLNPRWAMDAGLSRRLTGDDRAWQLTFGTAYAFGIASLIPLGGAR